MKNTKSTSLYKIEFWPFGLDEQLNNQWQKTQNSSKRDSFETKCNFIPCKGVWIYKYLNSHILTEDMLNDYTSILMNRKDVWKLTLEIIS